MLAASIVLSAASCTDDLKDLFDKNNGSGNNDTTEGFAFIAEIEQTRVDVVKDGDAWKTVWSGDDKLYVTSDKGNFTFANSVEELDRFVCTDANASVLSDATNIVITTEHENGSVVDSDAGKRGMSLRKEYERFPESGKVTLGIHSAFFRLACDYKVTLSTDAAIFSGVNGSKNLEANVTLEAGEDIWVAFTPRVEKVNLTATIAGKMELSVEELAIESGVIYSLGKIVPEVAPEPEPTPEGAVVYLVPNDDWKSADAWFAAYLWADSDSVSLKLGDDNGDGVYEAVIPENMTNIIFCRMNPAYTEFAWNSDTEADHVWTQTADLTVGVAPNNYYYITGWQTGEWNVEGYTPEPPAVVESTWAVAGTFNDWGDVLMVATDVANIFVAQGLTLNAGDEFKIKTAGSWDKNFGGGITNLMPNMWMKGYQDGQNISVAQSGVYDIYLEYAEGDEYGKIYLIDAGGDYTVATEQTSNNPGDNTEPEDPNSEYKIYVYKQNNDWTTVNLYSWDDAEIQFTGAWPGVAASATETINGYDYMVWAMPAEANGRNLNIILNNGEGGVGNQTADFALGVLNQDYYLLLNDSTLSFVEDMENPGGNSGSNPGEEIAGVASEWALAGDFNSWGDMVMYTTSTANLFVAKSVEIGAYKEIKVKQVGGWNVNYGVDGVNYLNANVWTKVKSGGGNFSIVNAGLYDVYFDNANKRIYVMTEGADFSTATEQTANGAAPDLSGAFWGLCGTHNNWSSPDIELTWDGTIALYVARNAGLTGEFKVRANNSWGEDYGCNGTITVDADAGTAMTRGGGNCKVASGTYDVYFDLSGKKVWVRTPGSAAPTK